MKFLSFCALLVVLAVKQTVHMENQNNDSVLHNFTKNTSFSMPKLIVLLLVIALVGVGAGFVLSGGKNGASLGGMTKTGDSSSSKGTIVGSDDTKTNKDKAEGVLKEGGIEGEGQYHLVRPGGDSQNVYLTSSNIDLAKFLNKKIRVWGQTNTAQKAGWLMDVGRLEVLE